MAVAAQECQQRLRGSQYHVYVVGLGYRYGYLSSVSHHTTHAAYVRYQQIEPNRRAMRIRRECCHRPKNVV
jgi:hypothetical protein